LLLAKQSVLTIVTGITIVSRSCFYHLSQHHSISRSLLLYAITTLVHAMICTQGGPCEFCLHWPLFLKHSIYSECCCSSYKWHSKICSYFRLCPRLASLAPYSIAHTVQTFSLMRNRLAGVARTYLRSHPQCFLHFTCQELLVIFQSWSDNYFALRSAVTQAPGALSMLDPQL